MYWGDTNIYVAISDNLIDWEPLRISQESYHQKNLAEVFLSVLRPRKNRFDSSLVEPGPPAMITDEGILLLYNSRNIREYGDQGLPDGT